MTGKSTAVCLASSLLGHYAHIGFLNELVRLGGGPDRVAGCSAGALAGALWLAGPRDEALEEEICRLNFRRAFFDLRSVLRLPGVLTWSYANGVLGGNRMRRRLGRLIGDRRLEEFEVPRLEIAVSNLTRRIGEVRTRGPLIELVLASMAMPLLYRPRRIGGEWLIDGGVANETPFTHWLEDPEIGRIVVHRIRYPQPEMRRVSLLEVVAGCHAIPHAELESRRIDEARAAGKEVVFLTTRVPMPRIFHRAATGRDLIEAGKETARRWIGEA